MSNRALHLLRRRLREAIADNQWLLPVLGAALGVVLALVIGSGFDELFGEWTVTVDRSRDTLMSLLALVFTALSIVLALASVAAQNVVSRFGSRVLRIYNRTSLDRWMIAVFALAAAFILTEQFQLRELDPQAPAPTAGLTISVLMLVAAGISMIWYISTILRWFRVDLAVRKITTVARQAVRAVERSRRGAQTSVSVPSRPAAAVDLRAPRSGHIAEIDVDELIEALGGQSAEVVVANSLGTTVVRGQPIGWVTAPDGGLDGLDLAQVEEAIDVSGTRELALSIEYGIVALVDIAIMALSPAVNDPNTAVEVIEEMGLLLTEIAEVPLGPYAVVDPGTQTRVVVQARTFGRLVEVATKQIVLYGLSDPFVADALHDLSAALARLDLESADRAYVDTFAASLAPASS